MSKLINISLPEDLVERLDKAAKAEYATRSDFIRESIVRRLKHQRVVDEWGDYGEWEVAADFRTIKPDGVPAQDVLSSLKRLTR